jgi:hypothetical protein
VDWACDMDQEDGPPLPREPMLGYVLQFLCGPLSIARCHSSAPFCAARCALICLLVGRYQHVFEEEEETIIAWADGYDEDEDKDKEVAAVWSYCDDDESFQTVSKFLTWLREESSESESESEDEDEEDD